MKREWWRTKNAYIHIKFNFSATTPLPTDNTRVSFRFQLCWSIRRGAKLTRLIDGRQRRRHCVITILYGILLLLYDNYYGETNATLTFNVLRHIKNGCLNDCNIVVSFNGSMTYRRRNFTVKTLWSEICPSWTPIQNDCIVSEHYCIIINIHPLRQSL